MKRLVILIALSLVSACGGGGGGGSNTGGGTGSSHTATVNIVVTRSSGAYAADKSASTIMSALTPTPTNARISVTNPNVNGVSFKQIQDTVIPGSLTLTIPIASGYTFELVTYSTGTTNLMEEYAVTQNVQIQAGSNTVSLTLNPIAVGLTVPASLNTAQSYSASVNYTNPSPLQSLWHLTAQTADYTKLLHLSGSASGTNVINMVAPVNNNQPCTLYFQAEFFAKSSLLNTGENYANWAFVYPNPLWGDAAISTPVTVASGAVTITFP
jgi:hypothetical protein